MKASQVYVSSESSFSSVLNHHSLFAYKLLLQTELCPPKFMCIHVYTVYIVRVPRMELGGRHKAPASENEQVVGQVLEDCCCALS